ncbi:unnamed protein product [Trichogramma brassicae]|uniref:Uncharacterized protein n=1 Tax=Trichogramma brassicae TaxID=86971 RepID=A0A6H5IGT9_9HYME|nr:unnamed protein product [Trichogramma brassicae]
MQCCSDPESPRSVPVGVPSVRRAVSTTARSFVPFPLYLASRTLVGDEHPLVWRVVHRQSQPGRGEIDTAPITWWGPPAVPRDRPKLLRADRGANKTTKLQKNFIYLSLSLTRETDLDSNGSADSAARRFTYHVRFSRWCIFAKL